MRRIYFIASLAIVSLLFVSCGENATRKLVNELESSYDYDGKEVTLEGYFYPTRVMFVRGGYVNAPLCESAVLTGSDNSITTVKLKYGKEPNCIYFPEKYKLQDLEVYDNEGNKFGYNDKLKITGIVKYTTKGQKEKADDDKSLPPGGFKIPKQGPAKDKEDEDKGDGNNYNYEIIDVKITKD